ncbi:probable transcriptional regulator protein, ROK family (plasmid) [Rhizobium etli CFN 42]|uniref:ROK family transcriptional regulator protein n=2 Tax=Rhizobium etli TaxID=29449 RepID=A0AAN1BMM3_RHIET|nr:ROK family transcriptional regulator [Rhizobium etli]ABC94180.1 probable transcriptional regulator protein, ROK family [Rhizobium etli CFN 42]AGS26294.1 ROK family transcriptional regulator protein [Rhizobium etli bv. mimosae str. Mim1]ARQ14014.1 ROK family transcriptional regulator protein [Rhizobium etli]
MKYAPLDHVAPHFLRDTEPARVASRNERDLLRLIWKSPGIERSSLTDPLDLTQQSLHRIVGRLHDRGMVAFSQSENRRPGPPSPELTLRREWCLTLGISINVGTIGLCLMGFGEPLDKMEIPQAGSSLSLEMERIEAAVEQILARRSAKRRDILGVGLAVSGHRMLDTAFNCPLPLAHWSLIDLAPLLGERLGLPVWADNVARTAALAEAIFGVGRDVADFAYIAHLHGYGGGLVSGGMPFRGSFGNAGEISVLFGRQDYDDRPALNQLLEHLRAKGRVGLTLRDLKNENLVEWDGVEEWIDRVTPAHNRAINAICAIFDPALIVLGGELPHSLARMLIERTEFNNLPRHGALRDVPGLAVANIIDAPGAIGAALIPLFETVL